MYSIYIVLYVLYKQAPNKISLVVMDTYIYAKL